MKTDYDPINHIYKIDGRVVPSCTQVLASCGFIDSGWFTEESRERGNEIHYLCEQDDIRSEDLESQKGYLYLQSWKKFKKDFKPVFLEIEQPHFSETYQMGCTPDRIAEFNGDIWILDIKTGAKAPWHILQLAGNRLCTGYRSSRMADIYLCETGYKFVAHPEVCPQQEQIFQCALTVTQAKLAIGL